MDLRKIINILIISSLISNFTLPGVVYSQAPASLSPFGGPILAVLPICCNGILLVINRLIRYWPGAPPTISTYNTFIFEFGTSQLITGTLAAGKQSLGMARIGGICQVIPFCVPFPVHYTVHYIGTSKPKIELRATPTPTNSF